MNCWVGRPFHPVHRSHPFRLFSPFKEFQLAQKSRVAVGVGRAPTLRVSSLKVDLQAEKIGELVLTGGVGREERGQSGAQQPPTQHQHGGWGAGKVRAPPDTLHRGGWWGEPGRAWDSGYDAPPGAERTSVRV